MTGRVTLVEEIETDKTPYTVTLSSDGRWLAYGDGFWYGMGHIVYIEPGRGVVAQLTCEEAFPADSPGWPQANLLTISGLCFDQQNRFLAASAWLLCQKYYPALLFRMEESRIVPYLSCIGAKVDGNAPNVYNNLATGVRLHDGKLIVRRSTLPEAPDVVFSAHPLPSAEDLVVSAYPLPREVDTTGIPHHLTSSRMALVGNAVATGFTKYVLITGLSATGTTNTHVLPTPHQEDVSAITADATSTTVITGG